MAYTIQQSEVFAMVQIGLTCTSSHTSSHSSGSICDSQVTAVSRDPSTLSVPAEVSGAVASPVGVDGDADQGPTYNTAAPAHITHRPPPQSAAPSKDVPEFIELERGLELFPVSPTTMSEWRYTDRATAPSEVDDLIIEPMDFEPSGLVLSGWTSCTHPEGQLYYRKEFQTELRNGTNAVYTDQDLEDAATLGLVNRCTECILLRLRHYNRVPPDFELVLYVCQQTARETRDLETHAHYYLSTDDRRGIFWLQQVPGDLVTNKERAVHSKAQLGDAWAFQYWAHKELFPNHSRISSELVAELTESLRYLASDRITSETSTAPWDFQTLKNHISIVKELDPKTSTGSSSCTVARLMHKLAQNRFQHYHGEKCARLNINESVKEDLSQKDLRRSLWFLCLQPLCFYLPDQYLCELDDIFVDDLLSYTQWNRYINGLKKDWKNIMLPVTVLLTVDVGLLAIQSLDTGHAERSIAQISSYCSAIMSLGAILMCIILSRHHRHSGHSMDMSDVGDWLKTQAKTQSRAELFVITLSLPSVWFTWGVIMFCVALLWVAFDRTSGVTRVAVGIVALPTLAVVSWVIVAAWKHKHRSAYLTGRLSDMVRSRCTWTQGNLSTWISTRWRPSDSGRQGPIQQRLSDRSNI